MPKQKAKSQSTKTMTEIVNNDPRTLMKKERAFVKRFMKKGDSSLDHMGQRPKSMAQARRLIIALQDELDRSNSRHKKASDKVAELIYSRENDMDFMMIMNNFNSLLLEYAENKIEALETEIQRLNSIIGMNYKKHKASDKEMYRLRARISDLVGEAQSYKQERDSVLTTMKLLNK